LNVDLVDAEDAGSGDVDLAGVGYVDVDQVYVGYVGAVGGVDEM